MTIRLAFVITGLGMGGAEIMLLKLVSHLGRREFETLVISLADGGELRGRFSSQCGSVESLGMSDSAIPLHAIWRLRAILRRFRPDVIQGWMYHGNLMAALARLLLPGRVPVLWNVRGMNAVQPEARRRTRLAYRLTGPLSRFADRIVNNSSASAVAHERVLGYPRSSRAIIPNGFNTASFAPQPGVRARAKAALGLPAYGVVIGLIGRYHPDKDVPNFLEAARIALGRDPTLRFTLVGKDLNGDNRELRSLISRTGAPERFHALGVRDDIPGLMAALDIVVSASRSENFPNAIGEAMSCGVPCVVTDVGDCAELVGGTGRVVPPHDPVRLAAALQELTEMGDSAREALGTRARQRIVEKYSLDTVVRQYEQLYRELIAGRAA